uniref:PHD-type domain-containing protein n=1 Tax=Caenorhabditis tropicalis TaxID=1561998 RepID=A0A1I7T3U4_9PELO
MSNRQANTCTAFCCFAEDGKAIKMEIEDDEYEQQSGSTKVEKPTLREIKLEEPEELDEIPTAFGMVEKMMEEHPELTMEEAMILADSGEEKRAKFWEAKQKEKEREAKKEEKDRKIDEKFLENQMKEKKRKEAAQKMLETKRQKKEAQKLQEAHEAECKRRKVPSTSSSSTSSSNNSSTRASPHPGQKKTKHICPKCKKTAGAGTCLCNECGEWLHLKCAEIKAKEWTEKWRCFACK